MKKIVIFLFVFLSSGILSWIMAAELRSDAPETYVVKKGDTLWDISSLYLTEPWLWPEIWHVNPQVANPHLIYPGDILTLVYRDGQPRVVRGRPISGGNSGDPSRRANRLDRLQPRARIISEGGAIPTIPLEEIRPFLVGAQIVTDEELDFAPYVLSSEDERRFMATGNKIYVRGVDPSKTEYTLFRKGQAYYDPETDELLGIEAVHLGNGEIVRRGDPSTLSLKSLRREITAGDRLIPTNDAHLRSNFLPKPSPSGLTTRIIAVYGGVTQIGQYNVVVLNKGEREGMQVGHVQRIWQTGSTVKDKLSPSAGFFSFGGEEVKLPDEIAGTMMVFRTFEKVSLALVMDALRPMHVLDTGRSPNDIP